MPEPRCAFPAPCRRANLLKERLEKIEALLREHDPEDGYEWPGQGEERKRRRTPTQELGQQAHDARQ